MSWPHIAYFHLVSWLLRFSFCRPLLEVTFTLPTRIEFLAFVSSRGSTYNQD